MQISNSQLANVALYASFSNISQKSVTKQEYKNANSKTNVFAQSPYTTPRVEKVLQEGKIESIYPSVSQTPFSSALSQKQNAVSESDYSLAVKRIKELMSEISSFITAEQGEDNELSYYLSTMSVFFDGQVKFNQENLDTIKNQINNLKSDDKDIISSINAYFMIGASTAENAMIFFDYASDKIEGLPVAQIMQDLATIKGYWDNNSRENLTLDNGTKIGITRTIDKNGNPTQTLKIIGAILADNVKFNEIKFQNESIKTLLNMFKQRENLNSTNANLNSSDNLNLNNLNLSKTNSNKFNSTDNFLKALLNDIANDENSLTNLSV